VPDVPGVPPSAEELSALPHAELAARLAEAYRLIAQLTARVERLERQSARDSGTSSKPPSSDSPYKKKAGDRVSNKTVLTKMKLRATISAQARLPRTAN
jgi:hypothetical protein